MSEFNGTEFVSQIRDLLDSHTRRIEEKLTSVLSTNEALLKENIRLKKMNNSSQVSEVTETEYAPRNETSDTSKQPCVYMSAEDYGYRIWGKTYDMRSNIKSLGRTEWDNQLKCWKLLHTELTQKQIKERMEEPDSDTQVICKFEYLGN